MWCPRRIFGIALSGKLNVVKYKIHLYSLRNRPEKLAEGSLFCLFLKLVQINFIFTDNVRMLYSITLLLTKPHTSQPYITIGLTIVSNISICMSIGKHTFLLFLEILYMACICTVSVGLLRSVYQRQKL
jgi:hypothetical protein